MQLYETLLYSGQCYITHWLCTQQIAAWESFGDHLTWPYQAKTSEIHLRESGWDWIVSKLIWGSLCKGINKKLNLNQLMDHASWFHFVLSLIHTKWTVFPIAEVCRDTKPFPPPELWAFPQFHCWVFKGWMLIIVFMGWTTSTVITNSNYIPTWYQKYQIFFSRGCQSICTEFSLDGVWCCMWAAGVSSVLKMSWSTVVSQARLVMVETLWGHNFQTCATCNSVSLLLSYQRQFSPSSSFTEFHQSSRNSQYPQVHSK